MASSTTSPNEILGSPKIFKPVKALLPWEDPKKSGAILAGATVVYFLLEMSGYTMLYLIPTLMLVAVIASFVFSYGSRFLGRSHAAIKIPELDDTAARQISANIQFASNRAGAVANKVLSGEEPASTLKVAAGLYLVSYVGRFFHVFTLAYLVVVLAFTAPKVYQLKKTEIDQLLSTATRQAVEYKKVVEQQILSKLPPSLRPKAAVPKSE